MGMNPTISIIIPVYNTKLYLNRCVESLLNQTYKNIEIILVDDGSTDGSEELCDKLAKKDYRVKVIHQSNRGSAEARNAGLHICKGQFIQFVDSDDYIELNMCERLLSAERIRNADIVICGFFLEYPSSQEIVGPNKRIEHINTKCILERFFGGNGSTYMGIVVNKLYKREIFFASPALFFHPMRAFEDEFMSYKFLYRAKTTTVISDALYHYVQRSDSKMYTIKYEDFFDRKECILEYYRWADSTAPEFRKLIEYACVRIFNGFVWGCLEHPESSKLIPLAKSLNKIVLSQTSSLWRNPYINIKTFKNYILMQMGVIIPFKQMELKLRRKR